MTSLRGVRPSLVIVCSVIGCAVAAPSGLAMQEAQLRSVERDGSTFHVKREPRDPVVHRRTESAGNVRSSAPATVEKRESTVTEAAAKTKQSRPSSNADPVDTTGIWFHIEKRDAEGARREVLRLIQAYPDWTVPAEIAGALIGLDAAAALASDDPAIVIGLATDNPGLFTCTNPANAWALAEAHRVSGGRRQAFDRYITLARDCPALATRLASAQKAWALAGTQAERNTVLTLLEDTDLGEGDLELGAARQAERERNVWLLVEAGRLDEAQEAIRSLQTTDSTWRPTLDLEAAVARLEIAGHERDGRVDAIVSLASRESELFGCAYPANAWSLAEARGVGGDQAARLNSYLDLVRRCAPDVQVASLQKAWAGAGPEARARIVEEIDRDALAPAARSFMDIVQGAGAGEGEVWARIEAGDTAGARALFEDLRRNRSENTVSTDLLGALARMEVEAAQRDGAPEGVIAAAGRYPGQFGCEDVANAWALAEALGRVEGPRARIRAYVVLARQCDSRPDQIASLQKALAGGGSSTERYVRHLMDGDPLPAPVVTAMRRREIDRTVRRLAERRRAGDLGASGLAAKLAEQAGRAQDANAARELGWWELSQDRPEQALDWFDRAAAWGDVTSAQEGRALALVRAGRLDHAEQALAAVDSGAGRDAVEPVLVSAWIELARARSEQGEDEPALVAARQAVALSCRQSVGAGAGERLCGDAYGTLAAQQYRMADYTAVLATAAAAADHLALTRETREMTGWALISTGRPADAISVFERLYVEHADRSVADGLVTAFADAGLVDVLEDRAEVDGPLGRALADRSLRMARSRGMPLLAVVLSEDVPPALTGVESTTAGGAGYFRAKQGEPGRDRFQAWIARATASYTEGRTRVDVEVDTARVDIGDPSPGDPVGSATSTWTRSPTSTGTLVIPRVRLRHEMTDFMLEAEMGTSPIGGVVSPLPVGGLVATWYADPLILTGSAFSRSRWNSLLALSGMADPATGTTWGRISETGVAATGTVVISDQWAVSGGGLLSYLHGRNVDNNSRIAANLSASYDVANDIADLDLEFLRVGPYYRYESYGKNRSYFTLGHGGYFSPSSYHSVGAFVDWRTEAGKAWLLDGRASLGWTTQTEDSAPRFPLTPDGTSFAGSTSSGIAGDVEMRGEYLLDENWRLGGQVRYSFAPDYRDAGIGVRLTYSFDARSGLFGLDLPRGIPYGQ